MKVIKLTATALADIEAARESASSNKIWPNSEVDVANRFLADTELWTKSSTEPAVIPPDHYSDSLPFDPRPEGTLILYQDCIYVIRGKFTSAQQRLLVLEASDKERQHFERLKAKFESAGGNAVTHARHRIPEAVKIEVWRRDQGRCSTPGCGSRENLEYDHIIPIDAGGSNTARNVELLCESCNRRKSNKIQ
jgi:HNH endonuclease